MSPAFHQGRYLPAGHGASRPNDPGRTFTVRAGEDIRDLTLTLPAGVAIEGRVMDEAGEPLSRMNVIAARVMAGSDVAQRVGHEPATTDDLGRYRIYGLEPGEYVVAVEGRSVPVTRVQQPGVRVPLTEQRADGVPHHVPSVHARRIVGAADSTGAGPRRGGYRHRRGARAAIPCLRRGARLAGRASRRRRTGFSAAPAGLSATSQGFTSDAVGRFTVAAVEPGEYTLVVGGGSWSSPVGLDRTTRDTPSCR